MTLYAFKSGVSVPDEATMNSLLMAQSSTLIYDGTSAGSEAGGSVEEVNLSTYHALWGCDLKNGATSIGRIEIDVAKYGTGADLTVEIQATGGAILKKATFPAKIFTTGIISLPIDLNGLTVNQGFNIILRKNGDSTNHLRIRGSSTAAVVWAFATSTDGASFSTYNRSMRLNIFTNTPGNYILKHEIYGTNAKSSVFYRGDGLEDYTWQWLSSSDNTFGIVQKVTPVYDSNSVPIRWDVI